MSFWDKVKAAGSEISEGKWPTLDGEEASQATTQPADEKPSGAVRMALSKGASLVLRTTRKAVDSVVGRYHPPLTADAVVDPAGVRAIVEAYAHESAKRDFHSLVQLTANSLETVDLMEALLREWDAELKELDQALADDDESDSDTEPDASDDIHRTLSEGRQKLDVEQQKLTLLKGLKSGSIQPMDLTGEIKKSPTLLKCAPIAEYVLECGVAEALLDDALDCLLYSDPFNSTALSAASARERNDTRRQLLDDIIALGHA